MTELTPSRAVEHPFDRQRRAFLGIPGLVLLAALFATGGAATTIEMRDAAVADYETALAEQRSVLAQIDAVVVDYHGKATELSAIADTVQRVTSLTGEPIPADAAAALEAARRSAAATAAQRSWTIATSGEHLDGLTVAGIKAETAGVAALTEQAKPVAAQIGEASAAVDAASAALGKALGDYVTAVVQRGADLIKAHPAASQDQVDAFRSAIDALPDADTDALPDVLRAAIAAAARLG